jgi:uncharacterized protein YbaP (TraB family)
MNAPFSPRNLLSLTIALISLGTSANAASKCCVWRITNTKAPVYLVGSVHALNPKDYPLPKPYELAIHDSSRFLFEFDLRKGDEFSEKFEAAGKYPKGQDLRNKVHGKLLAWLRQNTESVTWKYDKKDKKVHPIVGKFDSTGLQYKPWYIGEHYFDPRGYADVTGKHGVDNYIYHQAKKAGKDIGGLESVDEHVQVFGGMSDIDSEIYLLDQIVHGYEDSVNWGKSQAAWRHGDTDKLWAVDGRLRREAPQISRRLIEDRNVRWIPRIEREIRSGKPVAIVAGAMHFSGPNSVVAMLRGHGYTIEQL